MIRLIWSTCSIIWRRRGHCICDTIRAIFEKMPGWRSRRRPGCLFRCFSGIAEVPCEVCNKNGDLVWSHARSSNQAIFPRIQHVRNCLELLVARLGIADLLQLHAQFLFEMTGLLQLERLSLRSLGFLLGSLCFRVCLCWRARCVSILSSTSTAR